MDDIILTGDSLTLINDFKVVIDQKFKIKDLGNLKYFLELKVAHLMVVILFVGVNLLLIF